METLEIIPLVMLVTGVAKEYIPSKFIPLLAIFIGGGLAVATNQDINVIVNGVLAGVGAIGTYTLAKGKEKSIIETLESLKGN